MKKLLGILAAALLLGSCGMPLLQPALGPAQESGLKVLVIDGDTTDAALAANPAVNYGSVIVKTVSGFDAARFGRLGAEVASTVSFPGIEGEFYRLDVAEGAMVKAINSLRHTHGVLWAEPELVSKRVLPVEKVDATERLIIEGDLSGDPRGEYSLYSLGITKALEAYSTVGYGTDTVLMAVIDTGINWTHEDFWGDLDGDSGTPDESVIVYAKSAFNKAADGTMTWVGDGTPFVTVPAGENWDDEAHGTHVAGTMLALGDNGVGVTGVAWKNARVISYKCFANAESGSGADWSVYGALGDLAAYVAIERATGTLTQATIPVNMSLGGSYAGSFELEMINYALEQGVLPIVAMGNDGMRMGQFPASYQGVLAVGATNGRDEKVHFSNTGHWISVSAPGYDIVSVGNGSGMWNISGDGFGTDGKDYRQTEYQWMSGTSMATPFVTGMVGYILSFDPSLTPYQVKRVLEITADDKGAAGFDEDFGYGRVNVLEAATMVSTGTGLPADNSFYLNTKIVATVENVAASYDSGIPGFAKRVVGATVSVFDATGAFTAMGMTNGTDGSVEFRGLPAGTYTLTVNYEGDVQPLPVTLDSAGDQSVAFSFDKTILFVSTVPNLAYNAGEDGTDTMLTLYEYNPAGTTDEEKYIYVTDVDQDYLDTLSAEVTSGTTYFVAIEPYDGRGGNYAIQVGFSPIAEANVADGARLAADNDSHEADDDFAAATLKGEFPLGTPFGANLFGDAASTDVDMYMFTIP
ncbi:MAG: dentilisin complex serine proteinase subunit PrtP [Spirochaetales bacterium]|nr:dentilisin complex serine proteinase subunit PrtP [Spirochaetales bacterium]